MDQWTAGTPCARFDDLVAGTAIQFGSVERVLVAELPEQVDEILDLVETLTTEGRWAFGFVTYEAANGLDPDLAVNAGVQGLPFAWFGIAEPPADMPVIGYELKTDSHDGSTVKVDWKQAWDAASHAYAVQAVRQRIEAGETYQCNLTTRLTGRLDSTPTGLYRNFALAQRGAYNAYLDTGQFVVVSASPELFFETDGARITMRPMKGTRRRGRTTAEDAVAVEELRNSPKERAENIMIVDLVRNDLARIAKSGTVSVPRLLCAERYETVHQLTSDVAAELPPGIGLADVFRALFPCGSVTGAPKARTMELIAELEDGPRGIYCGAIGVVAPPLQHGSRPRSRFSVAIRTALIDRTRRTVSYGTGGGITWDSDPRAEFEELLTKTRILSHGTEDFHLIETMRHDTHRGLRSFERHLARAVDSAKYFGFQIDPDNVRTQTCKRLKGLDNVQVRLRLFRDGGLEIEIERLPTWPGRRVVLAVDSQPIDSTSRWPLHQTSLRQPYVSRLNRHPNADDVLIVNDIGQLTEACTANLAVALDGQWWTPPVSSGCLAGVERGRLIEDGRLRERTLHISDLLQADELALVSAVKGWCSATLLNDTRATDKRVVQPPAARRLA
ncbi:aminodeoxychorismate synthase component I [Mycolicibacterium sp. CBMA 226]|uniref:aminodeoxychorismate synthase component I n=1 Tax=Mycolicibacterium sp. CBMA 226 TaxID=2606611 RepID=UPI0012DD8C38|nr:aminodeoxychorismate synthase component I [Mycolicibacterium sp. CBMA 226]MUL79012.1 aminodeoxychorismate synthase component I [Mycolicibacterium sp. CBMA 226]QGW61330.1 Aminodeoxychorismate synthase component 1 [Mycolicibacterium sp.]